MEKKSILQEKRERVNQLETEVKERFQEKQRLDSLARGDQERERESKRIFTVGRLFGRDTKEKNPVLTIERTQEVPMDDHVKAWLRQHAPEKLPATPPLVLDIKQQAQWAHHEYCDASYRLGRAKAELHALEKKIRESREFFECFAEIP